MGTPGLVDDHGGARLVGDRRDRSDVAHDADEVRLDEEHGTRIEAQPERVANPRERNSEREPGRHIDLGPHPDGLDPGQDEACEHGLVEVSRHDDAFARPCSRQRERLVALRRSVYAEAAEVGFPQVGGEPFGLSEQVAREMEIVGPGRERQVADEQLVSQLG